MAEFSDNPLREQEVAALAPLANSAEPRQTEAELKALFMEMFEGKIRPGISNTRTLGMPQIGSVDQFERAAKSEGIAIYREDHSTDLAPLRYVYEAWRARNPKRGLAMLLAYLQLMWPGQWRCHQLWQEKGRAYPLALSEVDAGNHFLTSRVRVEIASRALGSVGVEQVVPALRSVVPARILLEIAAIMQFRMTARLVCATTHGTQFQQFEGVATAQEHASLITRAPIASFAALMGAFGHFQGVASADEVAVGSAWSDAAVWADDALWPVDSDGLGAIWNDSLVWNDASLWTE